MQPRAPEVSLFYAVAESLTRVDLEPALEETLRLVARHLSLDAAWVWLLDPVTKQFYLAASFDLPPYLRNPMHMTGEPCWCMGSFFDGDFVSRNVDIVSCSRLQEGASEGGFDATGGLLSHASVALRFGAQELGLLNAGRAKNPHLSSDELQTLATIGAQIGVAVERARLAERAADAARAEERAALAREMHDTVAQDLAAITLQLESIRRKDEAQQPRIDVALDLARTALRRVRGSVEGLREDPLAGQSLVAALAAYARRFTSETGVQALLELRNEPLAFSNDRESEVFRIAAEALNNVRRHANARRVGVRLRVEHGGAILTIEDDGRGFDTSKPSHGFGITGMKERAHRLGAKLDIASKPGAGTTVTLSVPPENQ
ncbi:MAG: GAF domain-containing sensor histidine kinase [Candidatus Eremiobacteraeota bacterium]|nr:GAF domain-containing sensor histidine kinase [Candidatus Eremiobacteraeota bacterium]